MAFIPENPSDRPPFVNEQRVLDVGDAYLREVRAARDAWEARESADAWPVQELSILRRIVAVEAGALHASGDMPNISYRETDRLVRAVNLTMRLGLVIPDALDRSEK